MKDSVPAFDLGQFLPYRLAVAAAEVSAAFAETYRDEFGITVPEWRVLANLSQEGAVSVRDIHTRASLDKPKVSRAAARLEAAGLIAKVANTADRRLVSLSLTEAGHALMARLIPVALAFQDDLIRRLGEDAAALDAGLSSLSARKPARPVA